MPRTKGAKNKSKQETNPNLPQNPSPEGSNFSEAQGASSEVVAEQIDQHEARGASFSFGQILDRANENLRKELSPDSPKKPTAKRGGKSSAEINTLITSFFTILIASWSVPGELKPNEDEVNGLSLFMANILNRHLDLSGRLTADAIDMIGIVGIVTGYYVRTAPAWREYRGVEPKEIDRRFDDVSRPGSTPIKETLERSRPLRSDAFVNGAQASVYDPIRDLDPGVADFLDKPRTGGQE